jgi:hypothetical protein
LMYRRAPIPRDGLRGDGLEAAILTDE